MSAADPSWRDLLARIGQVPAHDIGAAYQALLGAERAALGAWYTPLELVEPMVEATLRPLVDACAAQPDRAGALLALRICDPACGCGSFLLGAAAWLGGILAGWRGGDLDTAIAEVTANCLHGVDLDPTAIELARALLPGAHLVCADALDDHTWPDSLDAFIGNPPWVSYVGRAAQPLSADTRARYARDFRCFRGYRNLQGLFVEVAARHLRPGGRLGLLLPSSMAEQAGYGPVRLAHDTICQCDAELPDFGDGRFEGVFQPCMGLLSTRRAAPAPPSEAATWPLARPDLTLAARDLLAYLDALPKLPPHLFGERGVQTTRPDLPHLRTEPPGIPLRAGGDIRAFALAAPTRFADPAWFGARLRSRETWTDVSLLIRQTATVPVAALSDGHAFRNSLLAGFADSSYPATLLLTWLNSSPVRWYHFHRWRDARQGMPQVKIGHLRALPAPRHDYVAALGELGARLSAGNAGISASEQGELDALASEALGLSAAQQALVARWWSGHREPGA
ncbi:MAG: N-6 DNA methylase [Armatimonadetes bacterium]|nr:N-6 DNA methylase [Armatimonadota bacterium]